MVGGAKGKAEGRRRKGIRGERGGKWRGRKKIGERRKHKCNGESWRKGQDSRCPSLELPLEVLCVCHGRYFLNVR